MRYLGRRMGFYLIAFWVSITLNFLLPRLMPGNPWIAMQIRFQAQLQQNPHLLDPLKAQFDTKNSNLLHDYFTYLYNMAHLNFGVSFSNYPTSVDTILRSALPWSLFLAGTSALLAFAIGSTAGVIVSWWRGKAIDLVVTPVTMFTQAFPVFFSALLVLYFMGVQFGWFPTSHSYGCNSFGTICTIEPGWSWEFIGSVADHAAMPILTLTLAGLGGWLLGMRSVMINTLAEDYVTMAEAKGLKTRRVMFMYAARNALLPQITSLAITLGYALTSLVLIERTFSYPGLGYQLVAAVQANDYPLMQAMFFLITVVMLAANFMADVAYSLLDPRVGVRAGATA